MKTERRHELAENELASWLTRQIDEYRPYAKGIVAGVLLVLALYFAFTLMRGNQKKNLANSWGEFVAASGETDADGLREIAAKYPRTQAAAWGMQTAGDIMLATGSRNMFFDRGDAVDKLKTARDDYQAAYNMADSDMLRQRALVGIAQSNEALNEFDKAEDSYQEIIRRWPDSSLAETAETRIAFLQNPSTIEFYDWFMEQKPTANFELPSNSALEDALDLGSESLTAPESSVESDESSLLDETMDETMEDNGGGDAAEPETPVDATGDSAGSILDDADEGESSGDDTPQTP